MTPEQPVRAISISKVSDGNIARIVGALTSSDEALGSLSLTQVCEVNRRTTRRVLEQLQQAGFVTAKGSAYRATPSLRQLVSQVLEYQVEQLLMSLVFQTDTSRSEIMLQALVDLQIQREQPAAAS